MKMRQRKRQFVRRFKLYSIYTWDVDDDFNFVGEAKFAGQFYAIRKFGDRK